jgi:membrane protease YdiL (CAAX protease family)
MIPGNDQSPASLLRQWRLALALAVLAAWVGAGFLMGFAIDRRRAASMAEVVQALSSGILWHMVAGICLLAAATLAFRWTDLGFTAPRPLRSLWVMWFPLLWLAPLLLLATAVGFPPTDAIAYYAINAALIGIAEEWMFRGILFRAMAARFRLWPAVILTTLLFGALHVLNGFIVGDWLLVSLQAAAAAMTGLLLIALVLRTGSILPAIAYHALWNFAAFLVTYEAARQPPPEGPLPLAAYLAPLVLVTPNFLCALLLLRRLPKRPAPSRD